MESFFLNIGLSWTWSKVLPYLLMVIVGIVLARIISRRIKSKWPKRISYVLIVVPVSIYFAFVPIYRGDFSNHAEVITRTEGAGELTGNKLVVITIPNCPYCAESIERMKVMKDRNSEIEVEYIVCSEDPQSTEQYKELGSGKINVTLAEQSQEMIKIAQGRFPTFILVGEGGELTRWSNDAFGVRAMDEVESAFN